MPTPSAPLATLTLLLALPSCIVVEDAAPAVGVGVESTTADVFRGMTQNERFVLRPSVDVFVPTIDEEANGGISGSILGFVDLKNTTGNAWKPDGHAGRRVIPARVYRPVRIANLCPNQERRGNAPIRPGDRAQGRPRQLG